jgi:hypothetical protein
MKSWNIKAKQSHVSFHRHRDTIESIKCYANRPNDLEYAYLLICAICLFFSNYRVLQNTQFFDFHLGQVARF